MQLWKSENNEMTVTVISFILFASPQSYSLFYLVFYFDYNPPLSRAIVYRHSSSSIELFAYPIFMVNDHKQIFQVSRILQRNECQVGTLINW